MTKLLICELSGSPTNSATSAIVLRLGVAKTSGLASTSGSGDCGGVGREAALSRLAEYPHFSHIAIQSSPASDGTMNSCDWLPPIAPEWASTTRYFKPQRSKIRQ